MRSNNKNDYSTHVHVVLKIHNRYSSLPLRVVPRPYTFDYMMYTASTSYKERSRTYPSRVSAVSLTIRDLLTQPPIYVM